MIRTQQGYEFQNRERPGENSLRIEQTSASKFFIGGDSVFLNKNVDLPDLLSILQGLLDTGSLHPPEDKTQALEEENAALRKRLEAAMEALKEGGEGEGDD